MNKWMKIALRNILKNKRRSLNTLVAIMIGFAAISLFKGYAENTFQGLRRAAIHGEGLGHLTISKQGWLEKKDSDEGKYMLSGEEVKEIIDLVKKDDDIILATPKIKLTGLVTNGSISTIFIAEGLVPQDDSAIRGSMAGRRTIQGDRLGDENPYGIEMAKALAARLDLSPGTDAVLMAGTLDGQMNALDAQVSGVYDTGNHSTNDKFLRLPLSLAQSLYETEKADRIVVLLHDWKKTEIMKRRLFGLLSEAGISCEIRTWEELSQFYRKVKGLYNIIFFFISLIVLLIVIMSISNTMGMAVLERTREIGTLRALGLKRRGVGLLFAIEGAMLGLIGSVLGVCVNVTIWGLIQIFQPTYLTPSGSSPVPLAINLLPSFSFYLLLFLVLLSLLAAIIPARHAASQNVVNAMGHA